MSERFKLHQPAPAFHMKGTLGELVTRARGEASRCQSPNFICDGYHHHFDYKSMREPCPKADPKCVDGCGHELSHHIVSETLEGYCSVKDCACTKFDNFAIEYGD